MLSTPWSRSFGLRVPIVNAPMGGVAGGRLAAAVTAAGGLGMVGMGSDGTRELLQTQLRHVRGAFGIGLVDWVMRTRAGLLEEALAARPALLSVSFGTDWSWVAKAHDAGIATATQVYDAVGARRAVDAGVDVLVARGSEGGGHGEVKLGTLPLLDTVLDAVTVPVLAGGGIASPRSLAAVLAAGASGAWVGTRLAACPEALTGDGSRRALIAARATDTAVTRAFDVAKGLPWPARFPSRVLVNDFVARWTVTRRRSTRRPATNWPPRRPPTIAASPASTPARASG
jgi:nitronate monooxygenase